MEYIILEKDSMIYLLSKKEYEKKDFGNASRLTGFLNPNEAFEYLRNYYLNENDSVKFIRSNESVDKK